MYLQLLQLSEVIGCKKQNIRKILPGEVDVDVVRPCEIFEIRVREKGSSGKGVFWKRGLFRKVHFLEILQNLEILDSSPENTGESDHCLEILEKFENLEIPPVQRPLS